MNLNLPEMLSISGSTVSELIEIGDGDAALLYLYLTASGRTFENAPADLSWSPERTRLAFDKLGVLKSNTAKNALAKPRTKPCDAKPEMQAGKPFYALVGEVQRMFGRILSSDELVRLFGIYDTLGLPTEVILQLIVYCTAETAGRASPPSMKYIEKAAYTWEREGILTLERAEQYIKERIEKKQESAKIKSVLQIYDRNFTPTERRYIDGWLALGFKTEAIAIAYDRTVTKTGKLSWNYMNSIITSWSGKGLYTAEDIIDKDGYPSPRGNFASGYAAPDENEVNRINRILRGLNEEKSNGT